MEQILTRDEILELVRLPKNFDPNLIDLDYGFQSKIYPIIPKEVFQSLRTSNPDLYKNIAKAGTLYAFVLDIPKIKVHISNFGINQFEQNKTRNAPWWDVRDLGLSWLKKADFYLKEAVLQLIHSHSLTAFQQKSFPLVSFDEMNVYYSLNNSLDSYFIFCGIMKQLLEDFKMKYAQCNIDDFLADDKLKHLIKSYLINQAIVKAVDSSSLIFLTTGIAVQYEELPWQKSVILTPEQLKAVKSEYVINADIWHQRIIDYLHENKERFPCVGTYDKRKIIVKKGGLFL